MYTHFRLSVSRLALLVSLLFAASCSVASDGALLLCGEEAIPASESCKVDISDKLAGGRVFWSAPSDRTVTVDVARSADIVFGSPQDKPVSLTAARGEAVSVWFGVSARPEDHVGSYELLLTDLQDEDGSKPARLECLVEWLRHVAIYQLDRITREESRDRVYSEVLSPRGSARPDDIDAPSNVAWLVTWRIPRYVEPGRYKATAILLADDGEVARRPIELRIYRHAVPFKKTFETALFETFSGYINSEMGIEFPLYSNENLHVGEWFRQVLAQSRIRMGNLRIWHEQFMEATPPPGGTTEDVWSNQFMQDSIVAVASQLKLDGFSLEHLTPWHAVYSAFKGEPEGRRKVKRFWGVYYPLLERHGWLEEAWTRLPDEFGSTEDFERAIEYVKWFRSFAPEIKIMTTSMLGNNDERVRLADYVDIWCPGPGEYNRFREFYRERLAAGDQVWPYIHQHIDANEEDYRLRGFFWWLYFQDVNGCTYFAVGPRGLQIAKPYGIRQVSDMKNGCGSILYAAPGELWRSTRLVRAGDGIEEWELLKQMDELSAQASEAGALDADLQKRIRQFRSRCERVFESYDIHMEMAQFTALRTELDEILDKLVSSLETPQTAQ